MMPLDNWDEIRTAYHVARAGTVSGAANALGVHHATVIRHVDALEERLGVKLFQRHARGYTATEAGVDLLQVAQATDDQFSQLAGRLRGRGDSVSGELLVTAIPGLSEFLVPCLARFQAQHPELVVRLLTDTRLFRLEYGEAHVAIRAGAAPEDPDNVVQPFLVQRHALYAEADYVARHGLPGGEAELAAHLFAGGDAAVARVPFLRWLDEHVPRERIVFRSDDLRTLEEAVLSGAGLGFLPRHVAARHAGLTEVLPARAAWDAPLWLVTHMDLHRSLKVQRFVAHLKADAEGWPLSKPKS